MPQKADGKSSKGGGWNLSSIVSKIADVLVEEEDDDPKQQQQQQQQQQRGAQPSGSQGQAFGASSAPTAKAAHAKDSGGGSGLFGGVRDWIVQKANPEAKIAKGVGKKMEAYFDKSMNRWVFPGEDESAEADAPPAPPPTGGAGTPSSSADGGCGYDPLAALMSPQAPVRQQHQPLNRSASVGGAHATMTTQGGMAGQAPSHGMPHGPQGGAGQMHASPAAHHTFNRSQSMPQMDMQAATNGVARHAELKDALVSFLAAHDPAQLANESAPGSQISCWLDAGLKDLAQLSNELQARYGASPSFTNVPSAASGGQQHNASVQGTSSEQNAVAQAVPSVLSQGVSQADEGQVVSVLQDLKSQLVDQKLKPSQKRQLAEVDKCIALLSAKLKDNSIDGDVIGRLDAFTAAVKKRDFRWVRLLDSHRKAYCYSVDCSLTRTLCAMTLPVLLPR